MVSGSRPPRKRATRQVGPPSSMPSSGEKHSTIEPESQKTETVLVTSAPPQPRVSSPIPVTPPTPLAPSAMRLVSLGGVSEIGRNMMTYEYDGKILIVDCGVLFPSSGEPGVDLILPDFSYIEDRLGDIVGLVLTHGHEDHIGAIPFLLQLRHDIPIYGTAFTNALVVGKCREYGLTPDCRTITKDSVEECGPFTVDFFSASHSIPGSVGVRIRCEGGTVVQTGDIKIDALPKDQVLTDLPKLGRFGDEGIDLFLVDSTNAIFPGLSPSESEMEPALRRAIKSADQLVVCACFSSNVNRVQIIADAARSVGRKILISGISMEKNMAAAREIGLLDIPEEDLISLSDFRNYDPSELVVITTGTQGETRSGLARIAQGVHRKLSMEEGDLLIMSSSIVPGNEESVYTMLNDFSERGINIITYRDARVHITGHGHEQDLLLLYTVARAKNALPVHGEFRHLRANAALAVATGIPEENVVIAPNGVCVDLCDGVMSVAGRIPIGQLYVDGSHTGDVGEEVLRERSFLAESGFIVVTIVLDKTSGQLLSDPQIIAKGFTEELEMFDGVPELIRKVVEEMHEEEERDPYRIAQGLRRAMKRWVSSTRRRRPMILPNVVFATPHSISD